MSSGFSLAVDFGTSNTAAVLREPDGRMRSVLIDGSPVLPSAVCREPSGRLLVGKDALAGAQMYPGAAEIHPKRCIDDGEILLGGQSVPVDAAIGAVLGHVAGAARAITASALSRVVLTYPASWGARRKAVLAAAAVKAGLPAPTLVPEPLAAAAHFVQTRADQLPVGACLLVYDFGAGTFDASVVRRTANGFDVLGTAGLRDGGGLDIDAALVANLGATYANRDPQRWRRLVAPSDVADHRARRMLWDDVRVAKERLSRASAVVVHVPGLDIDAPIGREQLDGLAMPVLERTIACARATLLDAGVAPDQLSVVLLVGGSSRIPLAATLLHRAFGVPPTVFDQPELVVAEGALAAADAVPAPPPTVTAAAPAAPILPRPTLPAQTPPVAGAAVRAATVAGPAAAAPSRRLVTRTRIAVAAGVLLVLVLALGGIALKVKGTSEGDDGSGIGAVPGGQWAGVEDLVSGSPVPGGASGAATPSPGATGTAKPGGVAGTPTGRTTTSSSSGGGGQPGGGTSSGSTTPASGDDTKASTEKCTSYRKIALTHIAGSSSSTPTFEIRACIWMNNAYVYFDFDYRLDSAKKTAYTFYPLGMYKCDAGLLENLGQHSSSATVAYIDGVINGGGVQRGQAASYHGQGEFKVSLKDDNGNEWSTNGTAVTVRTSCLAE